MYERYQRGFRIGIWVGAVIFVIVLLVVLL